MQIFISWSGDASKECAEALRDWLPLMNQTIVPFVSSQDISKGERGLAKIASQLQACSFGIVCVTRENQTAPWINFEAGALSRELGESFLIPFLLDMPIKDISGPLSQFQGTDSSSEDDVWGMVKSINEKCEASVDQDRLRKTFNAFWVELSGNLDRIRSARAPAENVPERDTSDILNELVGLVREQSNRIGVMEGTIRNTRHTTSNYTITDPREVRISADTEDPEQLKRRISVTVRRVRDLLGEGMVMHVRRTKYGVTFECDPQRLQEFRDVEEKVRALAAKNGVGLDFSFGSEFCGFPPF
ncbi:toll/interleukin-1 receptor domain-containing protein [Streptomyces sp. NPDC006906]|uniref:toll/interleukin-1 receptor domain-containing protein n=1 Tax=Streptomyces sp. NPDC006906 TaxID=3154782 RepID=UPI0033FE8029